MQATRRWERRAERLFVGLCLAAILLPLATLVWLVADVVIDALPRLGPDFLTSFPSRRASSAGVFPALVGSVYLIGLTALFAVPLGVGAAVYLEEYGGRGRFSRLVELNIANLAGVPSIIYGLLGLAVFVRTLGLGRSLLAGALTLALLILPVIITATREALRTVPGLLREGSYALGATRWQTIRHVVLPMAAPGIMTGSILAISRAIGETAPLIVIGALTYMAFLPEGPLEPFTALPIQIFNWVSRPQAGFTTAAAAGIVVLLTTLLILNGLAVFLRNRLQRRIHV